MLQVFSLPLLLSVLPLSLSHPITKRGFSDGPVITANFPDPGLINVDNTWYAFATNSGGKNFPIATSGDFSSWTVTDKDALPNLPPWATGNAWAPDPVQLADGSFALYFTATTAQDTGKHCLGAATSSNVMGPYTASNTSFACPLDQGGAIDPAGFFDTDGSLYVVYKVDGNSLGGGGICGNGDFSHPTPIMLQKMSPDGLNTVGDATQILDRDANSSLVEAPSLIRSSEGTYVLFFSDNCFNGPDYDTKYATASAIAGPYTKAASPLLASGGDGGRFYSPGGADVSLDGTKLVFHSDENQSDASVRQMWTAGISISGTTVSIS